MLLDELAAAAETVGATSARGGKTAALADALRAASPEEAPIAVAFLSGELRQRQIGVGWASLQSLPAVLSRLLGGQLAMTLTLPTPTVLSLTRGRPRLQAELQTTIVRDKTRLDATLKGAGAPSDFAGTYELMLATPQLGVGRIKLGDVAADMNVLDLAQRFFDQATAAQPDSVMFHDRSGRNQLSQQHFEEAVREFAAAAKLAPQSVDELTRLAFAEFHAGRNADARTHVTAALALGLIWTVTV